MFIVLEYCSKGSLLTIMNNRLTVDLDQWEGEVRGYFVQAVAALQFSKDAQTQSTERG